MCIRDSGNEFTIRQLIDEGARPSAIRYSLAAMAHYRKKLNFSAHLLAQATEAVNRLARFRDRLLSLRVSRSAGGAAVDIAERTRPAVDRSLDRDLNVPEAMAHTFSAIREANRLLDDEAVDMRGRDALLRLVDDIDDVLGVLPLVDRERQQSLSEADRELLDARIAARSARHWATSDAIRAQLLERGIIVEDMPGGQRWRKG